MDSPITAYITLVCLSAVVNLFLGIYVFIKRSSYSDLSGIFLWGVAAKAIYCIGYAFSLTSSTLGELRFWSVVQYMGMPFAPPLGILFVLKYLGYRVPKGTAAALFVIPVISLLSNATNRFHHLHYKQYIIHETLGAPYYDIEIGVTYVIMSSFLYLCMLSSMVLLIARWKDTNKAYRPQLLALIAAHLVPMTTSILYLTGITPAGIDPVPMVVGLSSLLLWWAIESSRFLAIMPIAKDVIFQSMSDGVIVLDKSGRLVEFNRSCRRMFPGLERSMFGQPLENLWPALFEESSSRAPGLEELVRETEIVARDPEGRIYQVRVSPIENHGATTAWNGAVLIITDVTEVKELQQRLEKHAYYDDLTQILNRRAFFELCEARHAETRRKGLPVTVILFDVDHFKRINDRYGHLAGDEVLVHVARIGKSCLTGDMLFARYGGEEFVVAQFGQTAEEGREWAERLRERIAGQPVRVDGAAISVTSSFGVADASGEAKDAQHTKDARDSLQSLLRSADKALYEAKRAGRNRVCVHA